MSRLLGGVAGCSMTVFASEAGVVVDDVAVDTGFSGVSTAGWRVEGTRRDRQGLVACFFWGVDGCSETVQAGGVAAAQGGSGCDGRGWGHCWGVVDRPGDQCRCSGAGGGGGSEAGGGVVVVVVDDVVTVDGCDATIDACDAGRDDATGEV